MASEPKKRPSKPFSQTGATGDQQTVDVLNRSFKAFFKEMLRPDPNWSRPTDQQFVQAIAESIVAVGNEVRDGWGLAMLQTFVYDLQELINAGIYEVQKAPPDGPVDQDLLRVEPSDNMQGTREDVLTWEGNSGFNAESPLFRLGYSAAAGGPTGAMRQTILLKAFEKSVLPGLATDEDRKRWGPAKSVQRLYVISKFLTWLCTFQGSENPAAHKKWREDLAWLKANCYKEGMRFPWPDEVAFSQPKPHRRVPNAAFMKPLTLSAALAAVVGSEPLPRTEIVKKLWTYINKKGLQDAVNKRMINTDTKLRRIFGKSQVSMFEMAGLIGKHVR